MFSLIRNSFRSLIRSPLRTIPTVLILTLSIGLSLIMVTVSGAYQNELNGVSTQVGTDITVRPAGFFDNAGGGQPLDETKVDELSKLDHVVSISKTVQTRYSGGSLVSAIQPGTLRRQQPQI